MQFRTQVQKLDDGKGCCRNVFRALLGLALVEVMSVVVARFRACQTKLFQMILCRLRFVVATRTMMPFERYDCLIKAHQATHVPEVGALGVAAINNTSNSPVRILRVGSLKIRIGHACSIGDVEKKQREGAEGLPLCDGA